VYLSPRFRAHQSTIPRKSASSLPYSSTQSPPRALRPPWQNTLRASLAPGSSIAVRTKVICDTAWALVYRNDSHLFAAEDSKGPHGLGHLVWCVGRRALPLQMNERFEEDQYQRHPVKQTNHNTCIYLHAHVTNIYIHINILISHHFSSARQTTSNRNHVPEVEKNIPDTRLREPTEQLLLNLIQCFRFFSSELGQREERSSNVARRVGLQVGSSEPLLRVV
jgi:hypothetical protein